MPLAVRLPLVLAVVAFVGLPGPLRGAETAPPAQAKPAEKDQVPKPAESKDAPPKPGEKTDEGKVPAPAVAPQPEMVVTATRLATPTEKTGVSVTVVNGKENNEVFQNVQLGEALRDVPGITVQQSGAPGNFTTVFTRGGNSNHTLFLYDGWKVNRQGGNFDLGHVDPVQINRLEIARGPASSLFGTDAVTGAVNVITEKGAGRPELKVSAAGGTYGTDRETLSMQGQEKQFSYNVTGARLHRAEATFDNSALETYSYAGRFDYQFNADHSVKAIVRGYDFHKGYFENTATGYGQAVEPADPNDQIKSCDVLTGFEYKGRIVPIWNTTLRLGHYLFDYRIVSDEPNPDSAVAGFAQSAGRTFSQERRPSLDWQNDLTAYSSSNGKVRDLVTAGANVEQERYNQDDTIYFTNVNVQRTNWSVFMQNRLELYNRAFITTGVRREQNGQFGDFTTGRADVSILIPESDTRVHGAVGNAFRAPSFYEFFSAFGNPDLQPEKNFAYDVGVEQHFWKKRITLGGTWFSNDFKDLVSYSFDTNLMENLNAAHTRGFEFVASVKPIKKVTLRGTATLLHTEDATGRRLLRRPGNTYTVQVIAHPVKGLDLSLDLLRVGSRSDLGPSAASDFGRVHNDSYTRVDAAASYSFLDHWRAFGRVENLFNRSYEDVITFPSPGSNVLAGVEFAWRF